MDVGTRPLLRWAGSKRASVTKLASYWTDASSTYVEPFCGSAALFYHLRPRKAILADLNSPLINFYQHCLSQPDQVWDIATAWKRSSEVYYEVRNLFNSNPKPIVSAACFLYLNRTCFNGIFRTNRSGGFNVPFSGKRMPRFPTRDEFRGSAAALRNVNFMQADFEGTIRRGNRRKSFFFVDPPYLSAKRRTFSEYGAATFAPHDLDRLLGLLHEIDDRGNRFVLTYDADERAIFSGHGWNIDTMRVHRNVGGFASSRRSAEEVIITNVEKPA